MARNSLLRVNDLPLVAKSKNGSADWNPSNASPVRHGANQSTLHQGAAV